MTPPLLLFASMHTWWDAHGVHDDSYRADGGAVKRYCAYRLMLALWTVKRRALPPADRPDRCAALGAGRAGAPVDLEPLLEITRLVVAAAEVAQRGAAGADGIGAVQAL